MKYITFIFFVLYLITSNASQISFDEISLEEFVNRSEYILLVKKINDTTFKVKTVYYGVGPKVGKIVNVKEIKMTDK